MITPLSSSAIKRNYRYIIIAAGTLVLMSSIGFGRLTYLVILPEMKKGLHLSYTQAGLITTGSSIGFIIGSLIAGKLISYWSGRGVVGSAVLLLGISLGITGLSPTYLVSLWAQFISGVAVGIACVGIMAIPASWFIPRKRGRSTGVMAIGTGIGTTLSSLVLPKVILLYADQGWRISWYLVGLTVVFLSLIVYFLLRDKPEDIGLDPLAIVSVGPKNERKEKGSYLSATLWILCLIQLVWGIAYAIYYTFFVVRLTDEVGLNLNAAGTLWAVVGFVSIPSGLTGGFFSDLVGRKWGIFAVVLALTTSSIGIALTRMTLSLYLFGLLGGLVFNGLPPIIAAACQDNFEPTWIANAIGITIVFSALGQAIGPWFGGFLADTTGSFVWVYMVAASLFTIGAWLSLALKRI